MKSMKAVLLGFAALGALVIAPADSFAQRGGRGGGMHIGGGGFHGGGMRMGGFGGGGMRMGSIHGGGFNGGFYGSNNRFYGGALAGGLIGGLALGALSGGYGYGYGYNDEYYGGGYYPEYAYGYPDYGYASYEPAYYSAPVYYTHRVVYRPVHRVVRHQVYYGNRYGYGGRGIRAGYGYAGRGIVRAGYGGGRVLRGGAIR